MVTGGGQPGPFGILRPG